VLGGSRAPFEFSRVLSAAAAYVTRFVNGDGGYGQRSTVRIMKVTDSPIPHVLTLLSALRVQGQLT
jgi:hypothetical protein